MLLSACASEWESNPPTSETGGTGVMADGRLAMGQVRIQRVRTSGQQP
jgi:hypothetical protein